MTARIHVLVDEVDKIRYSQQAEREGKSLGAWLRQAAEERLASTPAPRFRTADDLISFFRTLDARGPVPEPDWDDHLEVMERSRARGTEVT